MALGGLALAACATARTGSPEAARQLKQVGTGYGVVIVTVPAHDQETDRMCAVGKVHPTYSQFCAHLDAYKVVTVNIAATSGKSFLKSRFVVPNYTDLRKGDIVQFRFEDADGFIKLASRGERPDCRWAGSPPWTIGFPFQEGGVECEGWSYKQVLHIDWLRG